MVNGEIWPLASWVVLEVVAAIDMMGSAAMDVVKEVPVTTSVDDVVGTTVFDVVEEVLLATGSDDSGIISSCHVVKL